MTLEQFISTLKTSDIKVSVFSVEDAETEIIKFYSDGYAGVESDILARTVKRWSITSSSAISVTLEEPETVSEDIVNP